MVKNKATKKEFVVVRGPPGVYAGYLEADNGQGEIEMSNVFCLWRWSGANTLLELAAKGVDKPNDCKFSVEIPRMKLKQIFQIIPCSDAAKENLLKVRKWTF